MAHDIHQKEIVWLGSRVLSSAKSNYSNIECKALGVIEAVKYFHKYNAGPKFAICSDHRPLQFIFNNSSVPDCVLAHLQHWAVTLRAYDYEIHHVCGETMYSADTWKNILFKMALFSVACVSYRLLTYDLTFLHILHTDHPGITRMLQLAS